MLQYLFDTDHLTLYDHSDVVVWRRFSAQPWAAVGISSTTVEEYLRGRLAVLSRHQKGVPYVTAHARLVESLQMLQQFPIIPFDLTCEASYLRLRAMPPGGRQPGSANSGCGVGSSANSCHS